MSKRLLILALTLAPSLAFADGFIYIPDAQLVRIRPRLPRPVRPHFPMQVTKHRVEIGIDDTVVRTTVAETFFNPNNVQLEGQYMFPLPPGASVSGFKMSIGGKEVSGEVLEKDKARGIYEQIVRQVRDPGLLEYVDRGLFRARVFPIPARGGVDVTIEYTETLRRESGVSEYRYPLDTGKYASAPYQNVVIDIALRSTQPLRSIHSPSHKVEITRGDGKSGEKEARITFEAKTLDAKKDFTLVWGVGEDALAPVLLTHRGHEKDGFFYLAIAPRPEDGKKVPPKDIVFVVDTSGSMLGKKIEQVRRALHYCVKGLNEGDRFNIVDFSTEARRFGTALAVVDEASRKKAATYIDGLAARGGTNLEEGLRFALAGMDDSERLQMVVLLTDGEPTIGIVRHEDLLKRVRESNKSNRRIFVFAVGEDLNAKLLDRLVKAERGASRYIRDNEDIEVRLSSFYDKIDSPVLTDIRLEFPTGGLTDVYPRPLPDVFKGEQLAILGRFTGSGHKSVIVRGKFLGEERVFEYSLDFGSDKPSTEHGHVARLWAARKVGYLIEQLRLSGESKEVKTEVIRLAKLYGIITPYTSYLIIEDGGVASRQPTNSRGGRSRYLLGAAREALGVPSASSDPKTASAPGGEVRRARARKAKSIANAARGAFDKESGADAIEFSRKLSRLKGAESEDEADSFLREQVNRGETRVKKVGSRTFYLQGKRWVDAALTPEQLEDASQVETVKYLSDEYFALLTKHTGIGKVLSVGESVTFVWKGKVIAVDA
jgi:Ca-activated chloride channel family protein